MQYVLAIDIAKGKSMVSLISSCGEVLITPYEINHSIKNFTNLLNRMNKLKLDNISVIMESTGIYHRPVERFFLEIISKFLLLMLYTLKCIKEIFVKLKQINLIVFLLLNYSLLLILKKMLNQIVFI